MSASLHALLPGPHASAIAETALQAIGTRPDVLIYTLSQAPRGQHTSCEHISLLPELAGVVAQLGA